MDKPMEFNDIKELTAAAVLETGKDKLKIADTKKLITKLYLWFLL